jgi:hypothetical protein
MGRPAPICRRAVAKLCAPCVAGDPTGRPFDPVVDTTLRDYLNLLQVGFVPVVIPNVLPPKSASPA